MHAARVRFRSRSFRSCSSADSTTGSDPIPLQVHALLLVSARRFLNVVYCFCDAAAAAAARFGFKSAAAACLCDAEDAAAAATPCEASFGDAAGGLVESGQSATRRAIGRRIGATAAPCDADAAPFNDDFGDAAGEVVESKWRFLISMFSPATAVDVVNKLTASSN
jgi:hypothetical protein